jgi:hypothetical protein
MSRGAYLHGFLTQMDSSIISLLDCGHLTGPTLFNAFFNSNMRVKSIPSLKSNL